MSGVWRKGQLHTHTYWSDGQAFPEQMAAAYRRRGYDFACFSDHNIYADDPQMWLTVQGEAGSWPYHVSAAALRQAQSDFPGWLETKKIAYRELVRLHTAAEVRARLEVPGEFLLLPGGELTGRIPGLGGNYEVHMNYLNLPRTLPYVYADDVSATVAGNFRQFQEAAAGQAEPTLFMLNHPQWRYFDVTPQALIDNSGIRHFEVCNNAIDVEPQAECCLQERFWDVVNAFRLRAGQPCLFGAASDDTHFYDHRGPQLNGVVDDAWVMVRSPELTAGALVEAMNRGDYYASCGVRLRDIEFSPESRTLRVEVEAEAEVDYRIRFMATRRDFDRTIGWRRLPAANGRPERVLPVYDPAIGSLVQESAGVAATCQLRDEWLYVRAVVESSRPARLCRYAHPLYETAWTQPFC